jgi:hypothetical protein
MGISKEGVSKEYFDGYYMGRADEQDRILTLIKLDLLLPDSVKPRIQDLIRGGKELDD